MNAVSELISNRRKLVREVVCLAAESRLFQRAALPVSNAPFKPTREGRTNLNWEHTYLTQLILLKAQLSFRL